MGFDLLTLNSEKPNCLPLEYASTLMLFCPPLTYFLAPQLMHPIYTFCPP